MTKSTPRKAAIMSSGAFGAICAGAGVANAGDGFTQNNLISNIQGLAATTDSSLVNPWGVSFANGSPIWISDQGTSTSILPSVVGSTVSENFTVSIPPGGAGTGPTGQVDNAMGMGFNVAQSCLGNGA